jgi:hypothetical protein
LSIRGIVWALAQLPGLAGPQIVISDDSRIIR